jgi:hypothetical protein
MPSPLFKGKKRRGRKKLKKYNFQMNKVESYTEVK